jgi:hypothetical protein
MLALTAGRDARWAIAQMGHTDARLTLQVYVQVRPAPGVDFELVWQLMRFADEAEHWSPRRPRAVPFDPTNDPTRPRAASHEEQDQPDSVRNLLQVRGWAQRVSNLRPLACEARREG